MRAVLLIARSRLRCNRGATLLLILLAGVSAGIVMASLSGIRRADAGWAELQADFPDGDAVATVLSEDYEFQTAAEDDLHSLRDQIAAFPGVTGAARALAMPAVARTARNDRLVAMYVEVDPPLPALSGRPIVVAGRPQDPQVAGEVVINEELAAILDLAVGDALEIAPYRADQQADLEVGATIEPAAPVSDVHVVGIVRTPRDVLGPRGEQLALATPYVELGSAWWEANGPDLAAYTAAVGVDLDDGPVGLKRFQAQMADSFGDRGIVAPGIEFDVGIQDDQRRAITEQLRVDGQAQLLFAVVAALVAMVLVGLTLARQIATERQDGAALRAIGITRRDEVIAAMARSSVVAGGAVLVAGVVQLGLSWVLPRGAGSRVLRSHGMDLDLTVAVAGAITLVAVLGALSVLASLNAARPEHRPTTTRTVGDRVASLGAGVGPTLGARLAFDRSAAGIAGRTAVVAGALAVGLAVGAGGLVASIDDLVDHPDRLGQRWDVAAGNFSTPESVAAGVDLIEGIDGVEAIAGEHSTLATIDDRLLTVVGYEAIRGSIEPELAEGRPPITGDEVVLGRSLADDLDVGIGDSVGLVTQFSVDGEPILLEVVGIGATGAALADVDPGRSALVAPEVVIQDVDEGVAQVLVIDLEDGIDPAPVAAQLERVFPETVIQAPVLSRSVNRYVRLRGAPIVLAGVVAILAGATMVYALAASVRRRRHDLAVLRALGTEQRLLRRVVGWQALMLSLLAVALGVPFGLVLAAVSWEAVSGFLGVQSPTATPVLLVGAIVAVTLVVANLAGRRPGWVAARVPVADTLRSE